MTKVDRTLVHYCLNPFINGPHHVMAELITHPVGQQHSGEQCDDSLLLLLGLAVGGAAGSRDNEVSSTLLGMRLMDDHSGTFLRW